MIDVGAIPVESRMDLVASFYELAKKFYQDPENQKAYEKWAAERRMKLEQAG